MAYQITTQRQLRKCFWNEHQNKFPRGKNRDGEYNVDARMAFVDWIDFLCRDGVISEALAQRATL
jgi:hypothetical protein